VFGIAAKQTRVSWPAWRGRKSPAARGDAPASEDVVRLEPVGKNLPEKRSATDYCEPLHGRLSYIMAPPASSGVAVNERSAIGVSAVLACVSLLADMVAKLPLELYRRTKNGPDPQTKHPAIRLVGGRPCDMHSSFELRQLMMVGKELGGNGYARVFRDAAYRPTAIEWLAPCDVRPELVRRSNGNSMIVYHVRESEKLNSADIIHIKGFSQDGVCGVSPITILRESIGTALAQTHAAGKLMRDGTSFPGYLVSNQTLPTDKIRDAREEWDRQHAGAVNAGRVPILNGQFDFKQTNGMSMVDAQFIESRRFELQEIARHYRIPPFLIGDSTASTTWGTGIQEQTLGFLNFCLDPHLTAFEQALNGTLLTVEEQAAGYYFRFDRDELASVSRQDTASYFQTMRGIGVYSVNDIRRKLDEPTIPAEAGGDDYSLPFNNTGGAAQAKAEKEEPKTDET
jgi:HK97 family phage portal protein